MRGWRAWWFGDGVGRSGKTGEGRVGIYGVDCVGRHVGSCDGVGGMLRGWGGDWKSRSGSRMDECLGSI